MKPAILTRLREGPAYSEALYPIGDRKAVNLALAQLQAEGKIELTRSGYEITEAGRASVEAVAT
jgi:ribosomal protein S19E (S16A)